MSGREGDDMKVMTEEAEMGGHLYIPSYSVIHTHFHEYLPHFNATAFSSLSQFFLYNALQAIMDTIKKSRK